MPKRLVKFETPAKTRKPPSGSYGPRLKEGAGIVKFKASDALKEQIEAEARRWGMSVSNYMQAAIRTFITEGRAPKLQPLDE